MTQKYDAVIIGTGQSGPHLAKSLCQNGIALPLLNRPASGEPV